LSYIPTSTNSQQIIWSIGVKKLKSETDPE